MAGYTRSKLKRMGASRRYFCGCNKNGFVAGQMIWHSRFCHYHPKNVQAFIDRDRRKKIAWFILIALAITALIVLIV